MASYAKIAKMVSKSDYKIYLLDDNMFYLNILQQHLHNLGYTAISVFSDPGACFDKLISPPDIIFYDQGVDRVKGLDVLKRIKKINPDIYMIFICGPDEVETVIQSLKHGAFDYFVKGDNDVKNIRNIITKIDRVRHLLKENTAVRFKRYASFNSYE